MSENPKITVVVKKPKITVVKVPSLNVEKQTGLNCALYSILNLINNSSLKKTDIETVKEHCKFAEAPNGHYMEAGPSFLKSFYKNRITEMAFVQPNPKSNEPVKTVTDPFGNDHKNFRSREDLVRFLNDIEKTNTETIFQVRIAGGHGSLAHFVGVLFKDSRYTKMDSLDGSQQSLSHEEAKNFLSGVFAPETSHVTNVLFAKLNKFAIVPKNIQTKVFRVVKK